MSLYPIQVFGARGFEGQVQQDRVLPRGNVSRSGEQGVEVGVVMSGVHEDGRTPRARGREDRIDALIIPTFNPLLRFPEVEERHHTPLGIQRKVYLEFRIFYIFPPVRLRSTVALCCPNAAGVCPLVATSADEDQDYVAATYRLPASTMWVDGWMRKRGGLDAAGWETTLIIPDHLHTRAHTPSQTPRSSTPPSVAAFSALLFRWLISTGDHASPRLSGQAYLRGCEAIVKMDSK
ncbi:hypothetical protein ARMSODRAFT_1000909 [Armillaria solidipes]|uniref:Uncharacterized protein n=1 Tax=Armillaria solidipes TaxID=1076256 RepID=A0A2H3BWT9_9AGAR|nr:hypothetical protein ARMSODRAFT_1000909 [Armillaria solidipes]